MMVLSMLVDGEENKSNGHGAFKTNDGKRWVGEFKNNSPQFDNGKSKMQILKGSDGTVYEGETKDANCTVMEL